MRQSLGGIHLVDHYNFIILGYHKEDAMQQNRKNLALNSFHHTKKTNLAC